MIQAAFIALALIGLYSWKLAGILFAVALIAVVALPRHPRERPTLREASRLANQTVELLRHGMYVAEFHPYACGMGLQFMSGVFVYDEVQDGEMATPEDTGLHGSRRKEFLDPVEFTAWLTQELLRHPPGPTSEISYWRLLDFVDHFQRRAIK